MFYGNKQTNKQTKNAPFEQRVCSVQDAINYMEVTTLELADKLGNKIRPFTRKIFMANVTNGITQLSNTQTNLNTYQSSLPAFTRITQ